MEISRRKGEYGMHPILASMILIGVIALFIFAAYIFSKGGDDKMVEDADIKKVVFKDVIVNCKDIENCGYLLSLSHDDINDYRVVSFRLIVNQRFKNIGEVIEYAKNNQVAMEKVMPFRLPLPPGYYRP